MKKREVQIAIKGIQRDEENEEIIESAAYGEFCQMGDFYVLKYDEICENGDSNKTMLKLSQQGIEVVKRGSTNSKMQFWGGQITECDYETVYGTIPMSIQTVSVGFEVNEEGVIAEVDYYLYYNGDMISRNFLQVEGKFCMD